MNISGVLVSKKVVVFFQNSHSSFRTHVFGSTLDSLRKRRRGGENDPLATAEGEEGHVGGRNSDSAAVDGIRRNRVHGDRARAEVANPEELASRGVTTVGIAERKSPGRGSTSEELDTARGRHRVSRGRRRSYREAQRCRKQTNTRGRGGANNTGRSQHNNQNSKRAHLHTCAISQRWVYERVY